MATKKSGKTSKTGSNGKKPAKLPELKLRNREIDAPDGDSPDHLVEVKLVVLAPAGSSLDAVLTHVMSSVLRHPTQPLPVVNGYGAGVKNITLCKRGARGKFPGGGMICTGFDNKSVAKLPKVPIIEVEAP